MITKIQNRNNSGHQCPTDTCEVSVKSALESLVVYEIGYGGQITDITKTKVAVRTLVMDCVDTAEFTGTEEEMKLLVEAAALSLGTSPMAASVPEAYRQAALDEVMKVTKGIPLYMKLGGGMLLGGFTLKSLLIIMIGPESEEQTVFLTKQSNDELFTMMTMVRLEGYTLADVFEIMATPKAA